MINGGVTPPVPDELELDALRRLLDFSEGTFSLSIAICNSPKQRDGIISELSGEFGGIEIVSVPPKTVDVFGAVSDTVSNAERTALFVVDLEQSIPSDAKQQPTLRSLNASRELWEQTYKCPVVFWLPEYAATLLTIHAPDFWRYRSHRFEISQGFSGRSITRYGGIDGAVSPIMLTSLPYNDKQALIDDLKTRLADIELLKDTAQSIGRKNRWLISIGILYDSIGELDNAESYFTESLSIARAITDRASEAFILQNIGQIYSDRGDYAKAEKYLFESLAIMQEIGDRDGEGTIINDIGFLYFSRGDYIHAEQCWLKSLVIRREIGDRAGEGVTLNNISQIYEESGDFDRAEEYLLASLAIARGIRDKAGEGATLNNLGLIYDARGDYTQAELCLLASLAITREIGNRACCIGILSNLACIAFELQESEKALLYWNESYELSLEIDNKKGLFEVGRDFGNFLAQLGNKESAREKLTAALQIGKQAGFPGTDGIEEKLRELDE